MKLVFFTFLLLLVACGSSRTLCLFAASSDANGVYLDGLEAHNALNTQYNQKEFVQGPYSPVNTVNKPRSALSDKVRVSIQQKPHLFILLPFLTTITALIFVFIIHKCARVQIDSQHEDEQILYRRLSSEEEGCSAVRKK